MFKDLIQRVERLGVSFESNVDQLFVQAIMRDLQRVRNQFRERTVVISRVEPLVESYTGQLVIRAEPTEELQHLIATQSRELRLEFSPEASRELGAVYASMVAQSLVAAAWIATFTESVSVSWRLVEELCEKVFKKPRWFIC